MLIFDLFAIGGIALEIWGFIGRSNVILLRMIFWNSIQFRASQTQVSLGLSS